MSVENWSVQHVAVKHDWVDRWVEVSLLVGPHSFDDAVFLAEQELPYFNGGAGELFAWPADVESYAFVGWVAEQDFGLDV